MDSKKQDTKVGLQADPGGKAAEEKAQAGGKAAEEKAQAEAKVAEEKKKPTKKKRQSKKKRQWTFQTVSKCPRCGTTDTLARRTDTKKGRQYRQCQRAICNRKYTVQGKKV